MARRYVIIGAGAIGSHLAAQFTSAGIPAVLVARGAQLEALRSGPVHIEGLEANEAVNVAVVAGPGDVALTSDDILVLATKTQDAEAVLNDWAWLPVDGATGVNPGALSADLPLLVLTNGVETERLALRRFARTISVGTVMPAGYLEPGHVVVLSSPKPGFFQLGALPARLAEDASLVEQITADFVAAGYLARSYDDITLRKNLKLLHNILNGVDVLDGTAEEKAELSSALVDEAQAVLRDAGVATEFPNPIDDDLLAAFGAEVFSSPRAPRRSTWQSFARGQSTEVDFLNGEIVLIAPLDGLTAPLNERLQRTLGVSQRLGESPQSRHVSDVLPTVSVVGS